MIEILKNDQLVRGPDAYEEYRATCRMCGGGHRVIFTEAEVKEWYVAHGAQWIYAYYKLQLNWSLKDGVCGDCIYAIQQVKGRLN